MQHRLMEGAILVPLDGSAVAEQALPLAIAIAQKSHQRIWLATVQRIVLWPDELGKPELQPMVRRIAHADRETYLREICQRFQTEQVHLDPVLLPNEAQPVARELIEFIDASQVGLVVMATHGRGGVSRAWLGSVADELMRHSPAPVILVRADTEPHPQGQRILVPLDGSAFSESVMDAARSMAAYRRLAITLLQVVPPVMQHLGVPESPMVGIDADMTRAREDQARDYLRDLRERVEAQGIECATATVVGGNTAEVILDLARGNEYGMIAMATHGRGGLRRAVLGSVADKVVRGAELPVLVTRPTEVPVHQATHSSRVKLAGPTSCAI